MIRWCSYCQRFIGEQAPFDDVRFTHSICDECDHKLTDDLDGDLIKQTLPVRELFQQLLAAATDGDLSRCSPLIVRGRRLGLGRTAMLVGMLQPALYETGAAWQDGSCSVAQEHLITQWCEYAFALLAEPHAACPQLDVLLLQAPGNRHSLGPRFAAELLNERGISAVSIYNDLPPNEVFSLVEQLRPRLLGLSAALPAHVAAARALARSVRDKVTSPPPVRISGFAARSNPELANDGGDDVVLSIDELIAALPRAEQPQ